MDTSTDSRTVNLLGAFCLGVADRLRTATEDAAAHGSSAPAALAALHEFLDGGSMDRLRRVVGLTPSGAVRLVDRLEADGYIERRPGEDGRAVALTLTPAGRSAARNVLAAREAAMTGIVAQLDADDRAALTGLLENMVAALTRQRLAEREAGREPSGGWLCRLCDLAACGRPEGRCPTATTAAS